MTRLTRPRLLRGICALTAASARPLQPIRSLALLAPLALATLAPAGHLWAAAPAPAGTMNFGPYNATFLEGGVGLSRPLAQDSPLLAADAPWSITGWIQPALQQPGSVVIAALGHAADHDCRCLALTDGRLELRTGSGERLTATGTLPASTWHAVAATYDGRTARLYLDGQEIGSKALASPPAAPEIQLAPVPASLSAADPSAPPGAPGPAANSPAGQPARSSARAAATRPAEHHFGGSVANFQLHPVALTPEAVQRQFDNRPDFNLTVFDHIGAGWPWQEHNWRGLLEPQDPWTLPHSHTPFSRPAAAPVPAGSPSDALRPTTQQGVWTVGGWRLSPAPKVTATGPELSSAAFHDDDWYAAVVPGTVLTTLIARGVYPDPYYGLNNMAIPETLARQDYWYRSSFDVPEPVAGKHITLTFHGINYTAQVWLNGVPLGAIHGAFTRGVFDVTKRIQPGQRNVLAVRISPPPHPGIPHEESIAAGPGENGGNLAIDGPTFIAAEGWDWIPGIRDRNSGIWQPVELQATGQLHLLDPQVITHLPLPRTDSADVSIMVPVENSNANVTSAVLEARFEGVVVRKPVMLQPGVSQVTLAPAEFAQLHLQHPRLWWPNGYGEPNLYNLTVSVIDDTTRAASVSDTKSLRFGVRELTYELSLFDHEGRLRRVEVDPTDGTLRGERLVDVHHEAIKRTPNGWAESLTMAGETSPAVRDIDTGSLAPYLAIRVNGVPIAARGGSWGTDDALKRIARDRLAPYFQLHRQANLNIIRNWLGQNTEEVFYDLADEYGLLVLNDFWVSTQDFQMEPQDPQLFLQNARDVILRFRNHPSIAVWFGRNEGVPQPILNEGLAELVATLDGTRYYTGSSNSVNLQGSGPYNYRPPSQYFTGLARGFSVEVGSPSLSTLESLEASIPPAERWPISDTLAYHDWHFGGNGNIDTFMATLQTQFGAPSSLEDFERKAQMMNLVTFRAIFEGFQAQLWSRNSGRLLWMTHPSWPSNSWQIYSSDYDTSAAYYGVKSACEPVHAQMNLPDFSLAVVNTTREPRRHLTLTSRIVSLDNRLLAHRVDAVDIEANRVKTLASLDVANHLQQEGVVLVVLTLTDSRGTTLSRNVYWQGRNEESLQRLNTLTPQPVTATVRPAGVGQGSKSGGAAGGAANAATRPAAADSAIGQDNLTTPAGQVFTVELTNHGSSPALETKLTVVDDQGNRVLPVYYSDNYVTLLPGESRRVEIRCPSDAVHRCNHIKLRGWNVQPATASMPAATAQNPPRGSPSPATAATEPGAAAPIATALAHINLAHINLAHISLAHSTAARLTRNASLETAPAR